MHRRKNQEPKNQEPKKFQNPKFKAPELTESTLKFDSFVFFLWFLRLASVLGSCFRHQTFFCFFNAEKINLINRWQSFK